MMIYRRWARVPPRRRPLSVFPIRAVVFCGLVVRSTRIFATTTSIVRISDLFVSVAFFRTCCESSWLDSQSNAEYQLRNGIICELDALLTQCVGFRIEKTCNLFRFCLFFHLFLSIIIRYFSLMHGASKRDCRSPWKKVCCVLLVFRFVSGLVFRSAPIIRDIETEPWWRQTVRMRRNNKENIALAAPYVFNVSHHAVRMTTISCVEAPVSTPVVWFCFYYYFRCLPLF